MFPGGYPLSVSTDPERITGRAAHLVERERSLVLENTACAMKHAIVRPFRRRLHTLMMGAGRGVRMRSGAVGRAEKDKSRTTLTMSKGWPTRTCERARGDAVSVRASGDGRASSVDLCDTARRARGEILHGLE